MVLFIIGNNHSTNITSQKSWSSGMQLWEPWILHCTCWNEHFCEIYTFLYLGYTVGFMWWLHLRHVIKPSSTS
jgi:hypothetical protein